MQSGRDRLVESAILLISRNKGIQGVNMRAIAAHAHCAHTNVYNYFESYESLLWEVLYRSLRMMVEYIDMRISTPDTNGCEAYERIMTGMIDFAIEHEGLYKLISFEYTFTTPMPENVSRMLSDLRTDIERCLDQSGRSKADHEARSKIHDIVFGYVSGGICRLLQNRFQGGKSSDNIHAIKENLHYLIRTFAEKTDGRLSS